MNVLDMITLNVFIIMSGVPKIKAMDCDALFEVTHDLGMRIKTNDF